MAKTKQPIQKQTDPEPEPEQIMLTAIFCGRELVEPSKRHPAIGSARIVDQHGRELFGVKAVEVVSSVDLDYMQLKLTIAAFGLKKQIAPGLSKQAVPGVKKRKGWRRHPRP